MGGLLFGYDTAVISGAVSSIDANFIDPQHLSETARSSLSGWTISSTLFGCIIGAIVAGWVSNAIGRKGGMMVAGVLFLISAAGSAYPELGLGPIGGMGPKALTPFILYRILCGVGVGIASMLSPLYIAAIAPSQIRGRLVSFNQLSIVGGILLVYFVNWAIASQGDETWIRTTGWRLMLVSEAVPAVLFLALLTLVPDTPRWFVMKGRSDKALAVLTRLVGAAQARVTIKEIESSLIVLAHSAGASLFAFGRLVIVGLANVVFTVVAILTVDRLGRKPLMIIGGIVMGVAMVTLGFQFQANAAGLGPLIAVAAQWIANLFVSWSFKVLIGNSTLTAMFNHGFPYWIYGAMSFLAAAFVYLYVPETKLRTLEEIQNFWKRNDIRAAVVDKQRAAG